MTFNLPVLVLAVAALSAGCTTVPIKYKDVIAPEAAPFTRIKSEKPVLALALGSGGARGFAHVGVIKALEANGISPDIVVGTSAGAAVGALYAGGYRGEALEQIAIQLERNDIADYVFPDRGFIRGELLQDFINQALNNRSIEELPKTFAVVATDLKSGKIAVFNRGNTGMAVRASSSIPGIFQPVRINGRDYVDGDLKSPVPVKVAQNMGADIVIAVDVSRLPEDVELRSLFSMVWQGLKIMRQSIIEREVPEAQVVIRPEIGATRSLDFDGKRYTMEAGEKAALDAIPKIREWLEKIGREKTRGKSMREEPRLLAPSRR